MKKELKVHNGQKKKRVQIKIVRKKIWAQEKKSRINCCLQEIDFETRK